MSLEPGDPFEIDYGRNHRLAVVCLSTRQRRRCIQLLDSVAKAKTPDVILSVLQELEDVVKVCSPNISDEILDKLDDELMVQIVTKTLSKTSLSEDDRKKSE